MLSTKKLIVFGLLSIAVLSLGHRLHAEEVYRIRVGSDYSNSSTEELRHRIWQLERAVEQLQSRVFSLEVRPEPQSGKTWACRLTVFGKLYTATGASRSVAIMKTVKACSDVHHSIHCDEKDAKCSND